MNILFYYPSHKRTIPIHVPLLALKEKGHNVKVLTTTERGEIHKFYEANSIEAFAAPTFVGIKLFRLIRNVRNLVAFCRQNKIDVIHSHLQQANIISVLASFFLKSRLVVFRHHCKYHHLSPNDHLKPSRNEIIADWIINRLAKRIVVPAESIKKVMIIRENVRPNKIKVIRYMYPIDQYLKPGHMVDMPFEKPRLTVMILSRMTKYKRHQIALEGLVQMLREGFDIQVMLMDNGPEYLKLKAFVKEKGLMNRIHFLGFQQNILDYISCANVLIHPSLTDASSSAVKEAGLVEKIVMVCNGVGDFNEYIQHEQNGLLLNPADFKADMISWLKKIYNNPEEYTSFGSKLKKAIQDHYGFDQEVVNEYEYL